MRASPATPGANAAANGVHQVGANQAGANAGQLTNLSSEPNASPPTAPGTVWSPGLRAGLSYGLLGMPLAFVALPLYVVLPHHYASALGVPLTALGLVLLGSRLLDAFIDPLVGRWLDALAAHSTRRLMRWLSVAACALVIGFAALFFPPVRGVAPLLIWCAASLLLTYGAYSVLSIAHQAWGARLGGQATQRTRIVAWREGCALVGVVLASILPAWAGLGAMTSVFAFSLLLGLWALQRAPQPMAQVLPDAACAGQETNAAHTEKPWRNAAFRRLLGVHVINGIASAIPATLLLFFIRDRLQAPTFEALFLGLYFMAAALSMPLWVRAVARWGLARSWLLGMLLATVAFSGTLALGAGDVLAFALICAASGAALGADLALPSALLAGVLQAAHPTGAPAVTQGKLAQDVPDAPLAGAQATHAHAGAYFGWWNAASKLNLALAAGVALPALQMLGYAPGTRDPQALQMLSWVYAALPCGLKLLGAARLYQTWIRKEPL